MSDVTKKVSYPDLQDGNRTLVGAERYGTAELGSTSPNDRIGRRPRSRRTHGRRSVQGELGAPRGDGY
jgi:hypothetical protein